MGEHDVDSELNERKLRTYMKALLDDLRALEFMLEGGLLESGRRRIGAEQEMFLVDRRMYPAPVAEAVLREANDARLTTEIAKFNLEANLTPHELSGHCFSEMKQEIDDVVGKARAAAADLDADVLLSGILPTLRISDLGIDNITPKPRYYELNSSLFRLRGAPFSIHIKGLDELHMHHDNVMMESCNTSFQVHLQVEPREFAVQYNWAQAVTGPVLAAAVNSPILFGHRLWQETRLALFQHSVDPRSSTLQARSHPPRVGFGEHWLKDSVIELFREQIARFRVIMTTHVNENPMRVLARGEIPALSALTLHNGTIWPWNRACYGLSEGRAHLRIENRALPAGPTSLDEVANAAFFVGLMMALPAEYGDVSRLMSFDDAKDNFFASARHGLNAQLVWMDGRNHSAQSLILDQLLPCARAGLKQSGVATEDVDRYLGTIEERVRSGQTGAQWMLKSLAEMDGAGTNDMRQRTLTSTILENQKKGEPAHLWPVNKMSESEDWLDSYQTVGQFMSTDLFTVQPDDLVDMAASVMDWQHIRHVPVEDEQGKLVGVISHRSLLRLLARGFNSKRDEPVAVRELMKTDPVLVTPSTTTLEAARLMREHNVGCLPVVENGRLVGILTAYDFLAVSAKMFEERLVFQQNKRKVVQPKARAYAQGSRIF